MNSYKFSADDAVRVSDILTRTVAVGVGTMDEFAAAFPAVTTLASQAGVSLEEVGAAMGFMTQRGLTASIASTSLRQAIVSLLNPNKAMTDAMAAAGIASGEQALRTLGLAGTFQKLSEATGGSTEVLTAAVGSVEALQAAMAVGDATFTDYFASFNDGLDGATERARELQRQSAAFQFDLLKSALSELAITIGQAVLPALNSLLGRITPVITSVATWLREHPRLTQALVAFAGALAAVGPLLIGAGAAMKGLALAQTGLNAVMSVGPTILAAITSPVGLLVIGLTALATVLGVDVLGGLRTVVDYFGVFQGRLEQFGGDVSATLHSMFTPDEDGSNVFSGILQGFGMTEDRAEEWGAKIGRVADQVLSAFDGIKMVFEGDFAGGFKKLLDAGLSQDVASGIAQVVSQLRGFFDQARAVFADIDLYAAYYIGGIWNKVQPLLQPLINWFSGTGDNSLNGVLADVGGWITTNVIEPLKGIWVIVEPYIQDILDWFNEDFLEVIQAVPTWITENITNPLTALWTDHLQPALQPVADFVRGIFQPVIDFIDDILNKAADTVEMLRRIGGATPQRAINGEILPGQMPYNNTGYQGSGGFGTPGASPPGSYAPGSLSALDGNPYAQLYGGTSYGRGYGSSYTGLGFRDGGGRGYPGMAVAIGTGAQPEVFIPDAPGTFYPRGEGLPDGGAGGITLRDIIVYESGNPEETKRQVYAALLEMKHG